MLGRFASRICGSSDIYDGSGKGPESSINFVTCHDGFTLNDLVSYAHKHNDANGESNRDGSSESYSANYGVEGASDDPSVETVRVRQIKNFLLTIAVSRGVPMLLGGDEFRRSQRGNNNAYCQDNETSWFDWSLLREHAGVHRFVSLLNARRLLWSVEPDEPHVSLNQLLSSASRTWHGVKLGQPDWSAGSHSLAFTAQFPNGGLLFHVILNAYWEPLEFELPPGSEDGETWRRWIDTSLESPEDIVEWQAAPVITERKYRAEPRTVIVLFAGRAKRETGTV
jgi:glycogen operon protein